MQESLEARDRLVIEPSACLYDLGGGLSEPRSFARRDPRALPVRRRGGVCVPPLHPAQEQLPRRRDDAGPDVWGSLLTAGPVCQAVRPTGSQPPPQPSQVQGPTGLRDRGGPLLKAPGSGSRPLGRKTDAGTLTPRSPLVGAWRCSPPGPERGPPSLSGASSSTWNEAHEAFPPPDAPFPGDGDPG